jgi:Chaperone of endosialidase
MKTNILSLILVSLLTGFAGLQPAPAVVPPPDGGYPNFNTAEGQNALFSLTTGAANTAVGWFSLQSNATGEFNTATGAGALLSNDNGRRNTATGVAALLSNLGGVGSTGSFNTANGTAALLQNTAGFGNTAIGDSALSSNTTGSNNTALGFNAGSSVTTASNVIAIGTEGANVDNTCFIGNIRDVAVNASGVPVVIDLNNQLGTIVSSRRFKKEIKSMDKVSEAILALKPVTFHYKSDKTNTPQFGLVAEEVAKVNPDLVVRDKNGEIYTVRYDAVNAMLLNEFLKEHRKVEKQESRIQEQDAMITQLKKDLQATAVNQQKQIEVLTAGLQKVSAQLELTKPAPQTVLND